MQIEATGFALRQYRHGDEASLALHANNPRIWRNMPDTFPHPYTEHDAVSWVEANAQHAAHLAIEIEGAVGGGIGFTPQQGNLDRMATIGYWLGERFWGRGIATRALELTTAYAFDTTDLARLEAHVFEWNAASCRVLEKAGYELEGRIRKAIRKDGALIDYFIYGLLR